MIPHRKQGFKILNPKEQPFGRHLDATYSGYWDKEGALEDIDTARPNLEDIDTARPKGMLRPFF
jgi:hypothetical protein